MKEWYRAKALTEREVYYMAAVSFVNTFLSYLMLMLVIVVLAGVAVAIGITLRKKKNAQTVDQETSKEE